MLGTVPVPVVAPGSCDSPRAGTVCAHTCHLQTPKIQKFFCPCTMEQHLPKHHSISNFSSAISEPKAKVSGKLCIRDETEPSVLLPVLHKGLIHHFFSPLLGSYQGFQCIFIAPYQHLEPGKSRAGMTFRLSREGI